MLPSQTPGCSFIAPGLGLLRPTRSLSGSTGQANSWEQSATPFSYRGVELSPDGLRAAVHREEREGTGDLWVARSSRGSTARLTFDATQHNLAPVWSPRQPADFLQ